METKLLKQIRKQQKLTQLEIAEKVGISIRNYQYIESGYVEPNVYTAQLISQFLQTTVEELFPLSQRNSSENTNSINKE